MRSAQPSTRIRARLVPMLAWARSYERRWLRGDLVAGVAVAALIVPKNLGYADIAGVPLQNGLYAAAAGAILYAVFGTSRQISMGPSSGLAAVAAGAVLAAGITGEAESLRSSPASRWPRACCSCARAAADGMGRTLLVPRGRDGFPVRGRDRRRHRRAAQAHGDRRQWRQPFQELRSWLAASARSSRPPCVVGLAALVVVFGLRIIAPRFPERSCWSWAGFWPLRLRPGERVWRWWARPQRPALGQGPGPRALGGPCGQSLGCGRGTGPHRVLPDRG